MFPSGNMTVKLCLVLAAGFLLVVPGTNGFGSSVCNCHGGDHCDGCQCESGYLPTKQGKGCIKACTADTDCTVSGEHCEPPGYCRCGTGTVPSRDPSTGNRVCTPACTATSGCDGNGEQCNVTSGYCYCGPDYLPQRDPATGARVCTPEYRLRIKCGGRYRSGIVHLVAGKSEPLGDLCPKLKVLLHRVDGSQYTAWTFQVTANSETLGTKDFILTDAAVKLHGNGSAGIEDVVDDLMIMVPGSNPCLAEKVTLDFTVFPSTNQDLAATSSKGAIFECNFEGTDGRLHVTSGSLPQPGTSLDAVPGDTPKALLENAGINAVGVETIGSLPVLGGQAQYVVVAFITRKLDNMATLQTLCSPDTDQTAGIHPPPPELNFDAEILGFVQHNDAASIPNIVAALTTPIGSQICGLAYLVLQFDPFNTITDGDRCKKFIVLKLNIDCVEESSCHLIPFPFRSGVNSRYVYKEVVPSTTTGLPPKIHTKMYEQGSDDEIRMTRGKSYMNDMESQGFGLIKMLLRMFSDPPTSSDAITVNDLLSFFEREETVDTTGTGIDEILAIVEENKELLRKSSLPVEALKSNIDALLGTDADGGSTTEEQSHKMLRIGITKAVVGVLQEIVTFGSAQMSDVTQYKAQQLCRSVKTLKHMQWAQSSDEYLAAAVAVKLLLREDDITFNAAFKRYLKRRLAAGMDDENMEGRHGMGPDRQGDCEGPLNKAVMKLMRHCRSLKNGQRQCDAVTQLSDIGVGHEPMKYLYQMKRVVEFLEKYAPTLGIHGIRRKIARDAHDDGDRCAKDPLTPDLLSPIFQKFENFNGQKVGLVGHVTQEKDAICWHERVTCDCSCEPMNWETGNMVRDDMNRGTSNMPGGGNYNDMPRYDE